MLRRDAWIQPVERRDVRLGFSALAAVWIVVKVRLWNRLGEVQKWLCLLFRKRYLGADFLLGIR
jgi:hypothetical protein